MALASCVHGDARGASSFGIQAVDLDETDDAEAAPGSSAPPRATGLPPPPVQPAAGVGGQESLGPWRERSRESDVPPGMAIDDEIARLGYVLGSMRASRGDSKEASLPPRAVLDAWERMLQELDGYLDQPPRATQSVQLVRVKVTIESELDLDRGAWRVPGHLTSRVRSRLAYLEHRIEQARLNVPDIRAGTADAAFSWPIDTVLLTSDFGWRRDPFHGRSRFHYGIDLDARIGQLISAAGAGQVVWADWNGGHGKQVEITHPAGWTTRYSHLSEILVRAGDIVENGDPIGLAGETGRSTGPHLHLEIWRDGDVQDPIEVLGEPPIHLSGLLP